MFSRRKKAAAGFQKQKNLKEKKKFWFSGFKAIKIDDDLVEDHHQKSVGEDVIVNDISTILPIIPSNQQHLKISNNSLDFKVYSADLSIAQMEDSITQDLEANLSNAQIEESTTQDLQANLDLNPFASNLDDSEKVQVDDQAEISPNDNDTESKEPVHDSPNNLLPTTVPDLSISDHVNLHNEPQDQYLTTVTLASLHQEYKSLFNNAKQESERIIKALEERLDQADNIVLELEEENAVLGDELGIRDRQILILESRFEEIL